MSNKKLSIHLQPHMREDYYLESCDVRMKVEDPNVKQGETLASIWKEVAWIPCCEFKKELRAEDEAGLIPLDKITEKCEMGFDCYYWKPQRDTIGDVEIKYCFIPQNGSNMDRSHPFFDTVSEENGAVISGVTSIVQLGNAVYHVCLDWDLSDTPKGTKAACTYGEGSVEFDGDWQIYEFILMIAGNYKLAQAGGKYNIYWLDDKLPDRENVEAQLPQLLQAIFGFFREPDSPYSIFIRKEPWEVSGGGTQYPNAFVCGYSDACPFSMEDNLSVLAHETTHRWTLMDDVKGEGTWFQEGMAELYSTLVPLRTGIISKETAAQWLTDKTLRYYNNPFQNLSYDEIYDRTWKDSANRELQEAPYGRGLVYLMETDYQMRKRYNDEKSLDDLIFKMIDIAKSGKGTCNVKDWVEALKENLGDEAVDEFSAVMEGKKFIEPNEQWLGGIFKFSRGHYVYRDRFEFDDALIWSVR